MLLTCLTYYKNMCKKLQLKATICLWAIKSRKTTSCQFRYTQRIRPTQCMLYATQFKWGYNFIREIINRKRGRSTRPTIRLKNCFIMGDYLWSRLSLLTGTKGSKTVLFAWRAKKKQYCLKFGIFCIRKKDWTLSAFVWHAIRHPPRSFAAYVRFSYDESFLWHWI